MKPTIPDVLPLVRSYCAKPGNQTGGRLHLVLDDGNVQTSSVQFCRDAAAMEGDVDGAHIADLLLLMSKTQRLKLSKLSLPESV